MSSPVSSSNNFSLQVEITGDGTAKIDYLVSNNGTDYFIPTGASSIATGLTKTTNTDGKDLYEFTPKFSKYMKLKITETGTSDSVTVNMMLAVQ